MNALFGLRVRVTVGERLIVGVATATAVFLTALQPPPVPRVTSASSCREEERRRVDVQKLLLSTIARNKECYGTKHIISVSDILVKSLLCIYVFTGSLKTCEVIGIWFHIVIYSIEFHVNLFYYLVVCKYFYFSLFLLTRAAYCRIFYYIFNIALVHLFLQLRSN